MTTTTPYDEARQQFRRETTEHELTVLHDDGLYRHLRVAKPGTRMWSWDVITWPGYLTIVGDIGDGYTFTREPDMFTWFNTKGVEPYDINPDYWRQKLVRSTVDHVMRFSPDLFRDRMRAELTEHFDGAGIPAPIANGLDELDLPEYFGDAWETAREFADDHDLPRSTFDDAWEWGCQDYDHHFLLACFAIIDAIRRYRDAYTSAPHHG